MIAQMIIGWVIGIAIVAPTSYYFLRRQLRKHDRLLAENEARLKAEHEEWLSKRRSGMTQEQRIAEDRYHSGLCNMPAEDRLKPRLGFAFQPRGMSLQNQAMSQSGFAPVTESNAQKQREGLLR